MHYRNLKRTSLKPGLSLLLLLLLLYNSSFAQKKNDQVGLSFGPSNFHITDEHTSPLIFRGTGIALQ